MASPRWILHADMDAFYASIEQRDRPELRGKPVIVGATSPRGVVAAASYEARRFGVRSAMPGFRARELCPDGVFLPSRIERYAAVSAEVHAVFRDFTPAIEPLALDEAFLDVSGSMHLFGGPEALARRLKGAVLDATELKVSVARSLLHGRADGGEAGHDRLDVLGREHARAAERFGPCHAARDVGLEQPLIHGE
jgi:DNA polymerase-4